MDKEILKGMPEYEQKLPEPVQELAFDKTWKNITAEIAKKYSLSQTQADVLTSSVLLVLIGLDAPETFMKSMTSELGISKLLADQIIKDLESRVFNYAINFIEKRGMKAPAEQPKTETSSKQEPVKSAPEVVAKKETVATKIPEIKPQNLPMVEKGEVAHDTTKKPEVKKPEAVKEKAVPPSYKPMSSMSDEQMKKPTPDVGVKPESAPSPSESHITYKSIVSNQPVQRPVAVPRFTATPLPEEALVKETPKPVETQIPVKKSAPITPSAEGVRATDSGNRFSPENMTNDKLKITQTPEKPKTEVPKAPPKYAVDPYREPIE